MIDLLTIVFGFIAKFAQAFVVWLLWGWFAEPVTGLALTYWSVLGLMLLWGILRGSGGRAKALKERIRTGREETDEEKLVDLIWVLCHLVLLYPFTAALGWVIYRIGS